MFSGEIHYFRMPEKTWKLHIQKAKEAGLNTISSYIPWSWHEYEKGKFDFEGKTHPQRNVQKFIGLVQAAGLYFSARVGPVSNAELAGEGLPKWLLKNYPEIFIKKESINNLPHVILLSYLNPTFQNFISAWYDQVLPLIVARQVTRGGNIILVQLCNEIGMIHWLLKGSDNSPFVTEMYQNFLGESYGGIETLNRAYRTKYKNFGEIFQPKGEVSSKNLNIFFDWALFYRKYYATYYKGLYERAKKHELEVPHSANAPQFYDYDVRGRGVFSPMTTSLYRDFSQSAPGTVMGGAYQMRRLDFENFHDVTIATEVTSHLDKQAPTICAELQTGIMRDRPRLYPSDVDLNIKSSVGNGLNGLNCYMFSSGENLKEMGVFGTYHPWQAAVGLDGKPREHFASIKIWGAFVKKFGSKLAQTQKVTDSAIGLYLPYYATEYYQGAWSAEIESARNLFFFDGFARLMILAGFQPEIFDLMKESDENLSRRKNLSIFSLEVMDEVTQEKLVRYVQGGGKLLLGPQVPSVNLKGEPCLILMEALAANQKEKADKEMIIWNGKECAVEMPIQTFNGSKSKPILKTVSGEACVVEGRSGKGQWLLYGFPVVHRFDYQVKMVKAWFGRLGIRPQILTEPWDIQATVRWGKEGGFLFIFNYHDVPKAGEVTVNLRKPLNPGLKADPFVKKFKLDRRSAVVIPLVLKNNKIVEVKQN